MYFQLYFHVSKFISSYGNPTNGQAAYIRPEAVRCSPNTTYYKKIEPANPHSYPWHVALAKRGIVLCSGTLVGRSWILTSGNCQMRKTVVYAGVANLLQFRGQNVQMRNVGEFEISFIFQRCKKRNLETLILSWKLPFELGNIRFTLETQIENFTSKPITY